jgi:hypothetical protein
MVIPREEGIGGGWPISLQVESAFTCKEVFFSIPHGVSESNLDSFFAQRGF